jgi:hypothetical protein
MKKTKPIFLVATIVATMAFVGCKKETKNPAAPISSADPVLSENGILKFKDKATFLLTSKALQQKNADEIASWEKSFNFESQYAIFNEVTKQENLLESEAIRTGDMSKEHSEYYFKALKEGVIKKVLYEDGSSSYNYNIFDASVVNVINKEGMVIIDTVLYQYTANQLKSMPYTKSTNTAAIKSASATNGNITITNYYPARDNKNEKPNSSYYWSRELLGTWISWDGGKKRATMNTDGYSNSSGYSSNTIVWKLNVIVQKKNWKGNWVPGDFICFALNSNWQYRYALSHNSDPNHQDVYYRYNPLSATPVTCELNNFWPSINTLTVNLEPSGTWFAYWLGYDFYSDATSVYNYTMNGSLCVGAGGLPMQITYP